MWALEKAIELKYSVPQVGSDSLAARLARGDSTLLIFDTRPIEYDVSRLRDAIRVDPDLDSEEFIAAHGQGVLGRDLIFYCSVGYRSSGVVQRVMSAAQEMGARSVSNLRGGLFAGIMRTDRSFAMRRSTPSIPMTLSGGAFCGKKSLLNRDPHPHQFCGRCQCCQCPSASVPRQTTAFPFHPLSARTSAGTKRMVRPQRRRFDALGSEPCSSRSVCRDICPAHRSSSTGSSP